MGLVSGGQIRSVFVLLVFTHSPFSFPSPVQCVGSRTPGRATEEFNMGPPPKAAPGPRTNQPSSCCHPIPYASMAGGKAILHPSSLGTSVSRGAQERLSEFTVLTSLLASTHMAPCKITYISRTFFTASFWILNLFLMKFCDSACSFQCGLQSPAVDYSGHRTPEVHDLERRENVMFTLTIL